MTIEKFDAKSWVIQIKEFLQCDGEEEKLDLVCISVFNVPRELLAMKPEAYIPQAVSIGPYHHGKPDLRETERHKLAAARRAQKRMIGEQKFESVVQEFQKLEWRIRSCYHKYLDYNGETLAWLMALDAAFVLECLQFYLERDSRETMDGKFIKQLGPAFDPNGRSAAHNAIERDIMMLENQVPLLVLLKLLEMELGSKQKAEEKLCALVRKACTELSPFKFALPEISICNVKERGHILELLYYAVVPIPRGTGENELPSVEAGPFDEVPNMLWKAFTSLDVSPVQRNLQLPRQFLCRIKPLKFIFSLPWRILSSLCKLPVLRLFKECLVRIFSFCTTEEKESSKEAEVAASSSSEAEGQAIPPSRDELVVPSVSDLYYAGVKFAPTEGDLTTIHFDEKAAMLYLPGVRLDTNTEVILRNLIAFEACAAPGALVFTRYIDFMNGIIDTEEDVSLLRNSGIIYNHLQNDLDVASLWNSMGKCVRLSKVQYLDKVISDLNRYYRSKWNVAMAECVKKYIFSSWQWLSLLAAAMLLLLTCLESFCTVYGCKKWIDD